MKHLRKLEKVIHRCSEFEHAVFIGKFIVPLPVIMDIQQKTLDDSAFYFAVGEKVRAYRNTIGFDQGTFAKHLGISRTTVIHIEKGRQRLSFHQACLVSRILGISMIELVPEAYQESSFSSEKFPRLAERIMGQETPLVRAFLEDIVKQSS